jgi:hypothetical protein
MIISHGEGHFLPRLASGAVDRHTEIANIAPQERRARADGACEALEAAAQLPGAS